MCDGYGGLAMKFRLAILGAGSVYCAHLVMRIIKSCESRLESIRLTDINVDNLAATHTMLSRVIADEPVHLEVFGPELESSALAEADVVVHIYRVGGEATRIRDEITAREAGLIAQETQGFGGFAQGWRNIQALRFWAEKVKDCAPNALNIMLSNPTGAMASAASSLGLRAIGLCELPYTMELAASRYFDSPRFDWLEFYGLNHFNFVVGGPSRPGPLSLLEDLLRSADVIYQSGTPSNLSREYSMAEASR